MLNDIELPGLVELGLHPPQYVQILLNLQSELLQVSLLLPEQVLFAL